jgi:hypothetical protein
MPFDSSNLRAIKPERGEEKNSPYRMDGLLRRVDRGIDGGSLGGW